ncbi:MAG TPA: Gfo/Idh/MocA family oxidoreductase [Polyangia bacterium]|jgi:predicted dehydrogenase|nr:Gfo/Idh/MocA family oxidoreductase [Polyangia bacterium]
MKFAIVGCGLIGQKRLRSLRADDQVVVVADPVKERAQALANQARGAEATTDWKAAVARPDVDAVFVSTSNDALAPVTMAAVQAGKHVLVEKPAARNPGELVPVIAAAEQKGVCVQVGFNHRYHPAFQQARKLFESGVMGPMMYIRARYGHGGRIGYDKEWRANPEIAGGGELLDQGVHLIDLARWFLGDFSNVRGHVATFFWDMPAEDNGFLLLETPQGQVAFMHATWTEWKNTFSFEITGRDAKLHIEGLGGSYGVERLSFYKMKPQMGPPETTIWEYPGEDSSWRVELEAFAGAIAAKQPAPVTLRDAHAALTIVHQVYADSKRNEKA